MQRTILEEAADGQIWQEFLAYKLEKQHLSGSEEKEIREFIEEKAYLPLCLAWEKGTYPSEPPVKKVINKVGTQKKRIVYSFEGAEGIFLKFVAFQLFRYDGAFADNCYAFRRSLGVRDAIRRIRKEPDLQKKYCLKVDISNYFNSIDVEILLQKLSFIRETDLPLYQLFERILREERVCENGRFVKEAHGAMAGTPLSPFFANIYLAEADRIFEKEGALYFRYSDDILLFEDSQEELFKKRDRLYEMIEGLGLSLNPNKVKLVVPGEEWEFLGFCYRNGEIDLSDNTIRKIKGRMKRKTDALRRWQRKKGLDTKRAAVGFIRAMNRKFYGRDEEDDFTWNRWFFPNLTVDTGLRIVDAYMQECIRYTVTGRHYKGNYRIRYETLKEWGYRSLVHEYYASRKSEQTAEKHF